MSKRLPFTFYELSRRDLTPVVPGQRGRISCYKFNYVTGSHRAPHTPRTSRQWRMRHLHGLMAFHRDRFYEKDRWYKARIEKPPAYPTCYSINPDKYSLSLAERLAAENETLHGVRTPVDIGIPVDNSKQAITKASTAATHTQKKAELERAARRRELVIDLNAVEQESMASTGLNTVRKMAEHFGVFADLFHADAFFNPAVFVNVRYDDLVDKEISNPVFSGNVIPAGDASHRPSVSYSAEPGTLYTLLLTNPDGNLYAEGKEVAHWLICNIPENRINEGDTLIDYMQPLPPKGTGYHRMIFVLFKQEFGQVDLSSLKIPSTSKDLKQRTFSTSELYEKYGDKLTPYGLAFYQTIWDDSCSRFFHKALDMEEPIFEYDWPLPYVPSQEQTPSEHQPFNLYLDKYRSVQDIEQELLTKRLKNLSPFDKSDGGLGAWRRRYYPTVMRDYPHETPTWQRLQILKEQGGIGKYRSLHENPID